MEYNYVFIPFLRGLRFLMQSSPLCQAGIQSRLCLHYFPMVSISLWDNLTCNPWACSLSSLRQNRPLNRRRIQVTGVFYPLTRRKQPPRASGAEWGEGKKQQLGDIEAASETRCEDARNPAQGGQSKAISPTLTSSTKLWLNGKIMEVASLAS